MMFVFTFASVAEGTVTINGNQYNLQRFVTMFDPYDTEHMAHNGVDPSIAMMHREMDIHYVIFGIEVSDNLLKLIMTFPVLWSEFH